MDLQTVSASVVAAVTSKMVFHPIDTIRTLRQTTSGSVWRMPMRAYWNGLVPSMSLSVPGFTTYLVAYRQTKHVLAPYIGESSLTNYVVSGAVAEIASSFIWTPMEVLKGRQQIATASRIRTSQLVRDIVRQEGVSGLFRGYWMGIAVFLPHSVVWWVVYERAKELFPSVFDKKMTETQEVYSNAASASAATIVAGTVTNLLDVVKTRQQLAFSDEIGSARPDDRLGVMRVLKNLIREDGLKKAFFRGLGVRLMIAVPSSALTMVIVEYLQPDKKIEQATLGHDEGKDVVLFEDI